MELALLISLIAQKNKTYFIFIISGDILNGVTGPIPAAAEPVTEAAEV